MWARRLAWDGGIVVVLLVATALRARQSNLWPDPKLDLALGGRDAWSADIRWWWLATAVGMVGLLLRGQAPVLALAAACAMSVAHVLSDVVTFTPVDLAAPIALVAVAAVGPPRWISTGALVGGALLMAAPFWLQRDWTVAGESIRYLAPALMIAAWLLGERIRQRQKLLDHAVGRAAALQLDRERQEQLAASRERERIARELHDVVAHGMSIVVIEAQAAARTLDDDPPRARDALAAIVDTGRHALTEMRHFLGSDLSNPPELTPVPGLEDIPELVERVRKAGLPIDFAMSGPSPRVSATAGLAAYRVTQEALTNALRHAGPGACARVVVSCRPDVIDVIVTDDGRGLHATSSKSGGGNGLRGMRERIAMIGGRLTVGNAPDGGVCVAAEIPSLR